MARSAALLYYSLFSIISYLLSKKRLSRWHRTAFYWINPFISPPGSSNCTVISRKKSMRLLFPSRSSAAPPPLGRTRTRQFTATPKLIFIAKLHNSLKETAETEYWLRLLMLSEYLTEAEGQSLLRDCLEIKRILIASINTAKENMK